MKIQFRYRCVSLTQVREPSRISSVMPGLPATTPAILMHVVAAKAFRGIFIVRAAATEVIEMVEQQDGNFSPSDLDNLQTGV